MTGPPNATSAVALSNGQEKPFSSEKFRNAWFRKYGIGGRPPFTWTSMLRRWLPGPRPVQVQLYEPVIAAGSDEPRNVSWLGRLSLIQARPADPGPELLNQMSYVNMSPPRTFDKVVVF